MFPNTTLRGFLDELTKIAHQGGAIGQLVNKDKFPTSDVGGNTPKRQDRAVGAAAVSGGAPNPEPKVPPEGTEENAVIEV